MKNGEKNMSGVKESLFPASIFAIYFGVLLLMSGIHSGLVVFLERSGWHGAAQTLVPLVYWGMVAAGLTLFTRKKIKDAYEEPLHRMAEAAGRVAGGDFSVYVPTIHTQDRWDYLDVMITDFNKMVEELGSIETLKTNFVSNVSHEMKTPIAVIKNYAELLQMEGLAGEQKKEYARNIEAAAEKISGLISNILRLNRLENQRIVPEVEPYDVCRQLCDCILQFEDAWEEKEIILESRLEDYAMVEADESLLELVWNNLISNAVKFTPPGGSITVEQTSRDGLVSVSVSDTGCGMETESIRHIFDKFYQADGSRSREGNGLGLALVKRVLVLLDGGIQVFSEPGKGSTFLVTLPAAGADGGKAGAGRGL